MTITYLAMGAPPTFTQADMPLCRQHIAQRIIANKYYTADTGQNSIPSATKPTNTDTRTRHVSTAPKTPNGAQTPKTPISNPRSQRRKEQTSSSKSSTGHSLQCKRRQHATTHRPLSPILLAHPPDNPTRASHTPPPLPPSPISTPPPHPPPFGGVRAGGPVSSPTRGTRSLARDQGRETTTTTSTDLTNRFLAFEGLTPPTSPSRAAVYTRQHTHPG